MQELNKNFDETDGQPIGNSRMTWHEAMMPRDEDDLDFDDDFRVLEQQYRHGDQVVNSGAQLPRY